MIAHYRSRLRRVRRWKVPLTRGAFGAGGITGLILAGLRLALRARFRTYH
jgi:hypothetical protein